MQIDDTLLNKLEKLSALQISDEKREEVKKQLSAGAQQTKIRHTSPSKIKDCIVWIPSLYEQKNIGEILFNIDRKIALNKAINHNLVVSHHWHFTLPSPDHSSKEGVTRLVA